LFLICEHWRLRFGHLFASHPLHRRVLNLFFFDAPVKESSERRKSCPHGRGLGNMIDSQPDQEVLNLRLGDRPRVSGGTPGRFRFRNSRSVVRSGDGLHTKNRRYQAWLRSNRWWAAGYMTRTGFTSRARPSV